MPTSTYVALASTTLTSPTSVVSFTSIPQTYKEIVFSISAYCTSSYAGFRMYYNNDTSNQYYSQIVYGGGGGRNNFYSETSFLNLWPSSANGPWDTDTGAYEISIPEYAQSSRPKTFLGQGFTQFNSSLSTGIWYPSTAISSVYFSTSAGSFATGSTFNLWGIDA